ncbi:MAG: adenylate/guanylate cyclase domain-containing protein [Cyanobacteria bacterium J06635_15]
MFPEIHRRYLAMPGLLQSTVGLLKSRLSRRIASSVFLSIITIEGVIFIPSYFRRYQEKLGDLELLSQEVLYTIKNNAMDGMAPAKLLPSAEERIKPNSFIVGAVVYELDGTVIDQFGEQASLTLSDISQDRPTRQLTADRTRYELAWPASQFQDQLVFVVRLDATDAKVAMQRYVLAIGGLVIIISAFVTLVTILVLEKLLIVPILHLRDDLMVTGEAVSQDEIPNFYTLSQTRDDELGEVAQAFGTMFNRIHREIHERKEAEAALKVEQQKTERLLLNILPASIAEKLKVEQEAIASRFGSVTILFADIVDFSGLSTALSPHQLVQFLNKIFSTFDGIAERHHLEKIKTIGDAYMVVGGLPIPTPNHAEATLKMALEMQQAIRNLKRPNGNPLRLRIGINTGPVVAGVIGIKKFSYDLWGDAVNVASRMESHGVADRIHVSATTYELLKHKYAFECRGKINIKGQGEMETYLLKPDWNGPKAIASRVPILKAAHSESS